MTIDRERRDLRETLSTYWNRLKGTGVGAVLVRGAALFFVVQVVGTGLGFVLNVVLARSLGAEGYGHYSYALTWLLVLLLPAKLGLDGAALRFVPLYVVREEWGLLSGFLRTGTVAIAVSSTITMLAILVFVCILGGVSDSGLRATLFAGLAMLPIHALAMFGSSALRGLKQVLSSQIPLTILYPGVTLAGVGLLALLPIQTTGATAMAVTCAAAVLCLGATAWSLRASMPIAVGMAAAKQRTEEWWLTSGPMLGMGLLQVSVAKTSILVLGIVAGTTEAGIYSAADRLATLLQFTLIAINSWAAPMIAELFGERRIPELQRMIHVAVRGLMVVSIPLAAGLVALGEPALSLFGAEFSRGYWVLVILCGGQLVSALAGPVGFLMTMTGHQGEAMWVEGVVASVNIALTIVLVRRMGIEGAAVATAVAMALRNVWMGILAWRRIGIRATVL